MKAKKTKKANLQIGKLYYIERKFLPDDSISVWSSIDEADVVLFGPKEIERIYLNKHNTFCLLGIIESPKLQDYFGIKL